MTTKNIKSRIQHKHDTEANWLKATNFIPLIGELIIYDPDTTHSESRFKIGDGATLVNDLPFAGGGIEGITSSDDKLIFDKPIVFEGSVVISDTLIDGFSDYDNSTEYEYDYCWKSNTFDGSAYTINGGLYVRIPAIDTNYKDEGTTEYGSDPIFIEAGGSIPVYQQTGPDTWSMYTISLNEDCTQLIAHDGNGSSHNFYLAKVTPKTNIPSDITDLQSRVSSLENNNDSSGSGSSSSSGSGVYYICAPLVNATYYYSNPNWFLALPPQSSCSKIILKSIRYVYQPKNGTPYTTTLYPQITLYEKGSTTSWSGDLGYTQGNSDGSGDSVAVSMTFFYYDGEFGTYASSITQGNDDFDCLTTSYFVFEITP